MLALVCGVISLVAIISFVVLIIVQRGLCKKQSKKRFIMPIASFVLSIVMAVAIIAVIAYASSTVYTSKEYGETLPRGSEETESLIKEYMDSCGIEFENEAIWEETETVEVTFGEDHQIRNMEFFDKNYNNIFSYYAEDTSFYDSGIAIAPLVYGVIILTFETVVLFVASLCMALLTKRRRVSEMEEINIMNL